LNYRKFLKQWRLNGIFSELLFWTLTFQNSSFEKMLMNNVWFNKTYSIKIIKLNETILVNDFRSFLKALDIDELEAETFGF
jgi:hypothetical protein